ncbi:DUF892 family protein [Paraburkholderia pallida]|uniref:DUF892 family protein n=1 Tax=Paraburkholderia pallida TaxID=2547399 RepID=UPI0014301625|nr:DUF892 family protein [Paraburkholderia pallida]
MSTHREELLCLLHDAYRWEHGVAGLLMAFLERHPDCGQLSAEIEAFLAQTLEHQRLLAECLARIEDRTQIQQPQGADFWPSQYQADPSMEDAHRGLAHVHTCKIQEIELYPSMIVAAESGGFFETRFVCEGIQAENASMAASLEALTSSCDRPAPAG